MASYSVLFLLLLGMMPVESSVIKRNVVFHHQIICDHFQRFSESLKNIKRYSCWHELRFLLYIEDIIAALLIDTNT